VAKVNFEFIAGLEGGPVLRGYVPDPDGSNSGVTIATGFDIGQRSLNDLHSMLSPELAKKLAPYYGLKKRLAVAALQKKPLRITAEQAAEIDQCVKQQLLQQLEKRFNSAAQTSFEELPEAARTVLASVAFQYGDLSQRCPKLWGAAMRADCASMANELRNFGDRYPTRRKKEADYLAKGVSL
jgi:hypothetical protein